MVHKRNLKLKIDRERVHEVEVCIYSPLFLIGTNVFQLLLSDVSAILTFYIHSSVR